MRGLAPYQLGLWLAEYVNIRCQLCGCQRSITQNRSKTLNNHNLASDLPKSRWQLFSSSLLCLECHNSIPWLPEPFNVDIKAGSLPIQSATYYDYPTRQAIRAFKNAEDMTKLPLLVHVLRQLPRPIGCHTGNSVIVPMPTTDSRLIKRGFDPVTILAAYLSRHWRIPLWHGIERIDDTVSQQGLSRSERLTNLNDAFTLTELPPVKRLILFDDVATTGASLQALGRTIHEQVSYFYTSALPYANNYELSAYALAHGSR